MKNDLHLAKRIRSMKSGQFFDVITPADRERVQRAAKTLFDAGAITFRVTTRENLDGTYRVFAL